MEEGEGASSSSRRSPSSCSARPGTPAPACLIRVSSPSDRLRAHGDLRGQSAHRLLRQILSPSCRSFPRSLPLLLRVRKEVRLTWFDHLQTAGFLGPDVALPPLPRWLRTSRCGTTSSNGWPRWVESALLQTYDLWRLQVSALYRVRCQTRLTCNSAAGRGLVARTDLPVRVAFRSFHDDKLTLVSSPTPSSSRSQAKPSSTPRLSAPSTLSTSPKPSPRRSGSLSTSPSNKIATCATQNFPLPPPPRTNSGRSSPPSHRASLRSRSNGRLVGGRQRRSVMSLESQVTMLRSLEERRMSRCRRGRQPCCR